MERHVTAPEHRTVEPLIERLNPNTSRWEPVGSARLQRVTAHPVGELTRLRALLTSHERRIGALVADESAPEVAEAAAQAWASLVRAGDDVSAVIAAMDAQARRQLAAGLDALEGGR